MFTIYGVYYIDDGEWRYFSTKWKAKAEAADFVREEAQRGRWDAEELEDALNELEDIEFVDDVVGVYELEVY